MPSCPRARPRLPRGKKPRKQTAAFHPYRQRWQQFRRPRHCGGAYRTLSPAQPRHKAAALLLLKDKEASMNAVARQVFQAARATHGVCPLLESKLSPAPKLLNSAGPAFYFDYIAGQSCFRRVRAGRMDVRTGHPTHRPDKRVARTLLSSPVIKKLGEVLRKGITAGRNSGL